MSSDNLELRVFISSTFQDLQAEREHLVKKVFPEIRALCRERGVIFTEVDLRWGLTEEHRVLGQIIRSCLDGIDRCRPYFIGITGRRYGYIPTMTEIYKDPELLERYPWIEDAVLDEASIIEMEFRYGLFAGGGEGSEAEVNRSARFYFREVSDRADRSPRYEREKDRLDHLKEQVRQWGVPVAHFATPEELGAAIHRDLLEIVRSDFAEEEAATALEAERQAHEAFAASRRRAYIPNMQTVRLLNEVAGSTGVPLVIHGPSGAGKSALLAYWAHHYRRRHPEILVVEHYVGIGAGAGDHYALMRHIMAEIREEFDRREEVPTLPEEIEQQFANWLGFARRDDARSTLDQGDEDAAPRSPSLVLILDGINQFDGAALHLVWLPRFIPSHVRLMVSVTDGEAYDQLLLREWEVMEMQPLTLEEREAIIVRFLSEFHKALSVDRIRRITSDEKSSSPLFLRTMLEELRLFGEHERLEEIIDEYLALSTIEDLFRKILERLEHDYGEEIVRDVMSLIHVSRFGLAADELKALTQRSDESVGSLLLALDFHLLRRDGLLTFFHDYLRRAVSARYITSDAMERELRLRLVEHFSRVTVSRRSATENCFQLFRCAEWERLAGMLSGIRVMMLLGTGESEYEFLGYWNALDERADIVHLYDASFKSWRSAGATAAEELNVHLRLSRLFQSVGEWGEARKHAGEAVVLARGSGDVSREVAALGQLGELQMLQGELHEAMESYQRQLLLATQRNDPHGVAEATGNIGAIDLEQGRYESAMKHFRLMLRTCEEIGDRRGVARSLGQIGRIHLETRQYDDAMNCYRRQHSMSESLGDRREAAGALGQIGLLFWNRRQYDEAMECYRREMEIARELGDKRGITMVAGKIGLIHERLGEYDEAMRCCQQYLQLSEELGYAKGMGFANGNLATIHAHLGDADTAMLHFDRALTIHRGIDFRAGVALWLKGKAEVRINSIGTGNPDDRLRRASLAEAQVWAEECLELSHSLGKGDTLVAAQILLARIDALQGRPQVALESLGAMQAAVTEPADAAAIEYELARLEQEAGNREEAHRLAASAIERYTALMTSTPEALHRRRIEELQSIRSAYPAPAFTTSTETDA